MATEQTTPRVALENLFAAGSAFVREHLAIVVGGATLLLIAFRTLALASFQPMAAVAVIAAGDPAKIALATVVGTLPLAFPVLIAVCAAMASLLWPSYRAFVLAGLAMFLGLLTVFTLPANAVAFLGLVMLEEATYVRDSMQTDERYVQGRALRFLRFNRAFTVFLFLLVATVALPPFLPREDIALADGTRMTGFVIATEGGWTTILSADGTVHSLPSASVVGRQLCESGGANFLTSTQPIIRSVTGSALPDCPS